MKRKALGILLAILMVASVFALSACEWLVPVDPPTDENEEAFKAVYELYVDYAASNGETPDSYEDWLNSIRGEDGKDGKDGKDGASPNIGYNGNWWIGNVDTGVSAIPKNGADGAPGEDGEDGEDGKDGVGIEKIEKISSEGLVDTYEITYTTGTKFTFTVTNGQNGIDGEDGQDGVDGNDGKDGFTPLLRVTDSYWEVSYDNGTTWTSLGVKATGEQGPQGEKGETGEQGPQGEPGKDGVGIAKIEKISSEGLVDTYEITYTDGTKTTFTITNGENGDDGEDLTACEHTFGEWIAVYEPSCDCIGISYRTCTKCNQVEHKYIEKLGHTMVDVYTMVNTCTQHTVMTKCSVCNVAFVEDREIEADHNYVDGICTMCGEKYLIPTSDEYFIFTLLEDETYSIKAKDINNMPSEVMIPSTYNGKAVTSIDDHAFRDCVGLTNVLIGEKVATIGKYAFEDCDNLISVVIPDNVTSIGDHAFLGCSSLASVVIGDSVTHISEYAFQYCDSLANITIPDSVTYIGDQAFYRCSSLTIIDIPDSVTSINSGAFSNTAYYNNKNNWVDGVLYIGNHLIEAKDTVSGEYAIKDGTITIAEWAFYNCSSLIEIIIPDSVTSIHYSALQGCSGLTDVYYTGSKEEWLKITNKLYITNATRYYYSEIQPIEEGNFWHWVDGEPTVWEVHVHTVVIDPAVEPTCTTTGLTEGSHCSDCGEVLVEQEIADIIDHNYVNGNCEFCGITSLEYFYFNLLDDGTYSVEAKNIDNMPSEVVIPLTYKGKDVTSIGYHAFYDCTSLASITIPDSVTSIGNSAFWGCINLKSVVIGDSVTSIGDSVFANCNSLTNVVIPDSVTSIGSGAFYNTAYYNDESNWVDDVLYIGNHLIEVQYTISDEYVIKDGTLTIADGAFSPINSLTSVKIPDSVTYIGDREFSGCHSLTSIWVDENNQYYKSIDGNLYSKDETTTLIRYLIGKKDKSFIIPDIVTSIGDWAFFGCWRLTSVTIPDSVTSIGEYAFYGCSSLAEIVISDNVTSINSGAFSDTAYYNDENNWVDGVLYIGNHLIDVRDDISGECKIKDGTLAIPNSAFCFNDNLIRVVIPDSVTSIGDGAFYSCDNLTTVVIGDIVTSIDNYAFYGCSGLTDVYYTGTEEEWAKISIGSSNSYLTNATIHYNYVPVE